MVTLPMIAVDTVRYNDRAPWPETADGFGPSLHRLNLAQYGNDPSNWIAAAASPGVDYSVGTPPRITQQPIRATATRGATAQFSVGAVGTTPLSFQWRFKGTALANGSGPSLLLTHVQDVQAGPYQVTVFNSAGATRSETVMLTIVPPPNITAQPQTKTVAAGTNVTFNVSAVGSGLLAYQWRFKGVDLPGATATSLALTNVQQDQAGDYTVLVTDAVASVLSQPASLNVLRRPIIVQGLLSQSAVPGETVSFVVEVDGSAPFFYRWRVGGATVLTTSGENKTAVLTLTNVQTSRTGLVSVTVSNQIPSLTAISSATLALAIDTDGNGLPDAWERLFGFNPASAGTATADPDEDGMNNLAEYTAGTDPIDPHSLLRLDAVLHSEGAAIVFSAVSNKTYTIEFTERLEREEWKKLADVPASAASGVRTILDPLPTTMRYYRISVPARP